MPRRRYRLFVVGAVVILFLLYRVTQNSWEHTHESSPFRPQSKPAAAPATPPTGPDVQHATSQEPDKPQEPLIKDAALKPTAAVGKPASPPPVAQDTSSKDKPTDDDSADDNFNRVKIPTLNKQDGGSPAPKPDAKLQDDITDVSPAPSSSKTNKESASKPAGKLQDDAIDIEDVPATANISSTAKNKDTASGGTGTSELPALQWKNPPHDSDESEVEDPPKAHWSRVPEHYPVPTESLIHLPTGTPKSIPKIQFSFKPESEGAKSKRTNRLSKVKAELQRSWAGYREYAWKRDELRPVSGGYRDKFGGWGATLVDSLDTLWIAGMKEEFDEAAKAVKDIDFTTSSRDDIQVFETTIRYLGGLIAAFDVSGGRQGGYSILLEKAVELAEILMGIFDTPNRMPVLYYRWRPESASQRHRASRGGMAELATLSMEFTRLAQITGEHKYYDAVARITNALVDLQESGTTLPGLFTENLDISGCNTTATTLLNSLHPQKRQQLEANQTVAPHDDGSTDAAVDGKGRRATSDDQLDGRGETYSDTALPPPQKDVGEDVARPLRKRDPHVTAERKLAEWECVPQGLTPSSYSYQTYHMGGGQDSAYEYFPKEYLLLGGLESKYENLHVDTINAINKWLMFRPMVEGDWDILFPAKVHTGGNPKVDLTYNYEVTHLTCFIGGMYGLGGKIFGRDQDIETAKKLTDGCVWAYNSTLSGIMPEHAEVVACPSLEKCEFNQTRWWEELDPSKEYRDQELAEWLKSHETEVAAKKGTASELVNTAETEAKSRLADENTDKAKAEEAKRLRESALSHGSEPMKNVEAEALAAAAKEHHAGQASSVRKRSVSPDRVEDQKQVTGDKDGGSQLPDSLKERLGIKDSSDKSKSATDTDKSTVSQDPATPKNAELDSSVPATRTSQREDSPAPSLPELQPGLHQKFMDVPGRPETHEEWVKNKIEGSKLPPGFTRIGGTSYILRPEAIESVWYMYRITGDPTWMEKGWEMFEATVRATTAKYGNSAVDGIMEEHPVIKDEMESFWIAETLKYYYLLFSEPNVVSLDEWVLNTEAHPFKRPV